MNAALKSACTILFIVLSNCIAAQKFDAGLLLGLNTSQITGDNFSGYNQPGLIAGIWTARAIGAKSKITMEIQYLPKGSRKNSKPTDATFIFYRLRLHYIDIPLVYQYTIYKNFSLESGLSYGALIRSYEADENGPFVGNFASQEQFKRSDISFIAGINWRMTDRLTFNLRSTNSIFAVRNHPNNVSTFLNRGQYSNCVMGRFQYRF